MRDRDEQADEQSAAAVQPATDADEQRAEQPEQQRCLESVGDTSHIDVNADAHVAAFPCEDC